MILHSFKKIFYIIYLYLYHNQRFLILDPLNMLKSMFSHITTMTITDITYSKNYPIFFATKMLSDILPPNVIFLPYLAPGCIANILITLFHYRITRLFQSYKYDQFSENKKLKVYSEVHTNYFPGLVIFISFNPTDLKSKALINEMHGLTVPIMVLSPIISNGTNKTMIDEFYAAFWCIDYLITYNHTFHLSTCLLNYIILIYKNLKKIITFPLSTSHRLLCSPFCFQKKNFFKLFCFLKKKHLFVFFLKTQFLKLNIIFINHLYMLRTRRKKITTSGKKNVFHV